MITSLLDRDQLFESTFLSLDDFWLKIEDLGGLLEFLPKQQFIWLKGPRTDIVSICSGTHFSNLAA